MTLLGFLLNQTVRNETCDIRSWGLTGKAAILPFEIRDPYIIRFIARSLVEDKPQQGHIEKCEHRVAQNRATGTIYQ